MSGWNYLGSWDGRATVPEHTSYKKIQFVHTWVTPIPPLYDHLIGTDGMHPKGGP